MQKIKKTSAYICISICCFIFGLIIGERHDVDTPNHIRLASACPILDKGNYHVAYDSRSKIPWFVYEHLTVESHNGEGDRRRAVFYEESGLYELHRSSFVLPEKSGHYFTSHFCFASNSHGLS